MRLSLDQEILRFEPHWGQGLPLYNAHLFSTVFVNTQEVVAPPNMTENLFTGTLNNKSHKKTIFVRKKYRLFLGLGRLKQHHLHYTQGKRNIINRISEYLFVSKQQFRNI